ncbi:MAG: hypothetical protein M3Y56_15245 [Armatimonadota bacterium]|nr:hypothetical protein [Armatimonadota bacterium]
MSPRTWRVTRHLLIGPQDNFAGVIHRGDAHGGDPAPDLSIVWSFLSPQARPTFFHAYGPVDSIVLRVARLRALWHTLLLMDYSVETGQQSLLRETWIALKNLKLEQHRRMAGRFRGRRTS